MQVMIAISYWVKFFDILEEVKKEEQTTIGDCCVCAHLKGSQETDKYETS